MARRIMIILFNSRVQMYELMLNVPNFGMDFIFDFDSPFTLNPEPLTNISHGFAYFIDHELFELFYVDDNHKIALLEQRLIFGETS